LTETVILWPLQALGRDEAASEIAGSEGCCGYFILTGGSRKLAAKKFFCKLLTEKERPQISIHSGSHRG
jgi:hypothetical protein